MINPDITIHKQTIRQGSKSFAMASFFFSEAEKEAAWKLYSWCRYCDDEIDEAPTLEEAAKRLKVLSQETKSLSAKKSHSQFQMTGMSEIVREYNIPMQYPLDLLRGMEMDVISTRFETLSELEEYCYCVAGTVGLMMCHILGIRSDQALSHAVSMGKAMQLTNICRDLQEDKGRGRLYLPMAWLYEHYILEDDLFEPKNVSHLVEFQERLLQRADELYQEGYEGLKHLSLRSAWAVLIAAKVYSEIGVVIRKNPLISLQKRSYVTKLRKAMIVFSTIQSFVPQLWWCLRGRGLMRRPQKVWSNG